MILIFFLSGFANELPKNNLLIPNNLKVPFLSARLPLLSLAVTYVNFSRFWAAFEELRRPLTEAESSTLRKDFEVNRDVDHTQVSTYADVQKQGTLEATQAWINQSGFLY